MMIVLDVAKVGKKMRTTKTIQQKGFFLVRIARHAPYSL